MCDCLHVCDKERGWGRDAEQFIDSYFQVPGLEIQYLWFISMSENQAEVPVSHHCPHFLWVKDNLTHTLKIFVERL